MLPFLSSLLILLGSAAVVRVLHRRGTTVFRLDQFRPASPLAGILPVNRDAERAHRDLQAVAARTEPGVTLGRTLAEKQAS